MMFNGTLIDCQQGYNRQVNKEFLSLYFNRRGNRKNKVTRNNADDDLKDFQSVNPTGEETGKLTHSKQG